MRPCLYNGELSERVASRCSFVCNCCFSFAYSPVCFFVLSPLRHFVHRTSNEVKLRNEETNLLSFLPSTFALSLSPSHPSSSPPSFINLPAYQHTPTRATTTQQLRQQASKGGVPLLLRCCAVVVLVMDVESPEWLALGFAGCSLVLATAAAAAALSRRRTSKRASGWNSWGCRFRRRYFCFFVLLYLLWRRLGCLLCSCLLYTLFFGYYLSDFLLSSP